jgi:hypothetical protein
MRTIRNRWLGTLALASVYALGLTGIIASSGSSGDGDQFTCTLEVGAIAPTTDGSDDIWVGLLADTTDGNYHEVVRVDRSGLAVNSYSIAQGTQNGLVKALAVATDALNAGDVYVGGTFDRGILRLNDDGSRDTGFVVGDGFNGSVNSIVAADDGSGDIYVGGNFTRYDGKTVSGLVRLNSDGMLDNLGFTAAPVADVEDVTLVPVFPGYIYSGGKTTPTAALWDNNGIQDTNFTPTIAAGFFAIASTASGDLYVGGDSTTGVLRLNNLTGNNDASFDGSGFDASIQSIVRAGDMTSDIYVGGGFSQYKGLSANGIIRLAVDGSRRATFIIGDGFTDDANNPASTGLVEAIAAAQDGTTDIYAGGRFAYYDGSRSNGVARLNANGSLDKGFDIEITAGGESCANDSLTAFK